MKMKRKKTYFYALNGRFEQLMVDYTNKKSSCCYDSRPYCLTADCV